MDHDRATRHRTVGKGIELIRDDRAPAVIWEQAVDGSKAREPQEVRADLEEGVRRTFPEIAERLTKTIVGTT